MTTPETQKLADVVTLPVIRVERMDDEQDQTMTPEKIAEIEKSARTLKAIHLRVQMHNDWRLSEDEHEQLDTAYGVLLNCAAALRAPEASEPNVVHHINGPYASPISGHGEYTPITVRASSAPEAGEAKPVAWLPVADFESLYEVSSSGEIRSIKSGKILSKASLAGDGYVKADLWKNNQRLQTYLHRVVARAFLEIPTDGRVEINHKDGNKLNNSASNLEWVTRSENVNHAMYTLGTNVKPVVATDLTDGSEERYPSIEAAARQGYSAANIWKCLNGRAKQTGNKTWKFAAPVSADAGLADNSNRRPVTTDRPTDAATEHNWGEAASTSADAGLGMSREVEVYLRDLPTKQMLIGGDMVDVVKPDYLLAKDRDAILALLAQCPALQTS